MGLDVVPARGKNRYWDQWGGPAPASDDSASEALKKAAEHYASGDFAAAAKLLTEHAASRARYNVEKRQYHGAIDIQSFMKP